MKWASVIEEGANLSQLVDRAAARLHEKLGTGQPDLVLSFCTGHFRGEIEHFPGLLQARCPSRVSAGCLASGVIGEGREVEGRPALSLVGAVLPQVSIQPFYLVTDELPDEDSAPEVWRKRIGIDDAPGGPRPQFILLADPFTSMTEALLAGLDYAYPGSTVVGGFASAGRQPGENVLWLGSGLYREGMVGLALSGQVSLSPVVAQGCRPIGDPLLVSSCRGTTLFKVGEETPLQYLNRLYTSVSPGAQARMKDSLVIGMQLADPLGSDVSQAPFLIRNLLQANYQNGSVDVGAYLRDGQVVQFHIRDRAAASEELTHQLDSAAMDHLTRNDPAGCLLFSCLGRGQHLFGTPDHDSASFLSRFPGVEPGGFFCGGEVGPVGSETYVHGFTSVFALIGDPPRGLDAT
ncbi:MAG: FIST C-terminal domain-containing protein [Verrucomicrobia bacterium]|nr:FIST C-terminal domain-containing protein [Verrucomicrobiota bacterium]